MKKLTELRKKKGITQVRLAIELGVDQTDISHWENGYYYPRIPDLI